MRPTGLLASPLRQLANQFDLHKLTYRQLRERFDLPAQMAVRCIAQVTEALKRDKTKQPTFRKHAAVPFDERNLSFKGTDQVSMATLQGRVVVPFVMGSYQRERFGFAKGQCDLVRRDDGKWLLLVTVDVPEAPCPEVSDFLGVDLGVTNLASDSDGRRHSGDQIEAVRSRYAKARRKLGKKTKGRQGSGKRCRPLYRAMRRHKAREARFRRDVNHVISKRLVATAKGTGRGLALEDLQGIRNRIRFRKAPTCTHERLGILPAAELCGVQSQAGWSSRRGGRSPQHIADMQRMRTLRQEQSQKPGEV